jgi:glutamate carboxypeptidase
MSHLPREMHGTCDGRSEIGGGLLTSLLPQLASKVALDLPRQLHDLEVLVNVDSETFDKAGVDAVGRWVGAFLADLGGGVQIRPDEALGDTVVGTFDGASPSGPTVLIIGHLDTVYSTGTARERPFRVDGAVAYGPGVIDMKGGLLVGLYALRALADLFGGLDRLPMSRIVFLANSDEEIGSPSSHAVIREFAAEADVALVLEAARVNGDIVSARKGVMDIRATISGVSAHAGVEFDRGRSAIVAAATMVQQLQQIGADLPDVTLNVGIISGGTRTNVVPEQCVVDFEVRALSGAHLAEMKTRLLRLLPQSMPEGTSVALEILSEVPPMEKLDGAQPVIDEALRIARHLGMEIHDVTTGGGSDANTAASLGVPTLDGLGPVGAGDHSPAEYVELASFEPRTTLLAMLIASVICEPVLSIRRAS